MKVATRRKKSVEKILNHLAPFHKDKDSNSLWVRFNELAGYINYLEIELDSYKRLYLKAFCSKNK